MNSLPQMIINQYYKIIPIRQYSDHNMMYYTGKYLDRNSENYNFSNIMWFEYIGNTNTRNMRFVPDTMTFNTTNYRFESMMRRPDGKKRTHRRKSKRKILDGSSEDGIKLCEEIKISNTDNPDNPKILSLLEKIEKDNGNGINEKYYGLTALQLCCDRNFIKLAKLLIEKGANIDLPKNENTPLMIACQRNYIDIVKFLLEKGANVNLRNVHGHTALMIAAIRNNIDIVRLLLEKNDLQNISYVLTTAMKRNRNDILKLLINRIKYLLNNINVKKELLDFLEYYYTRL